MLLKELVLLLVLRMKHFLVLNYMHHSLAHSWRFQCAFGVVDDLLYSWWHGFANSRRRKDEYRISLCLGGRLCGREIREAQALFIEGRRKQHQPDGIALLQLLHLSFAVWGSWRSTSVLFHVCRSTRSCGVVYEGCSKSTRKVLYKLLIMRGFLWKCIPNTDISNISNCLTKRLIKFIHKFIFISVTKGTQCNAMWPNCTYFILYVDKNNS